MDLSGKFRFDLGDLSGKFRFDLRDLPSEPFFHVGEIGFEDGKIVFRRKFFLGQARQGPRLYVGLPFRNPGGFQFFITKFWVRVFRVSSWESLNERNEE